MEFKLPNEVKTILNKFTEAGYQIYIVGGAVRDLFMGRGVKDWDFTTDAKPEEILKLFPEGFYDNKFGTVGIPTHVFLGSETTPESNRHLFESEPQGLIPQSRRPEFISGSAVKEIPKQVRNDEGVDSGQAPINRDPDQVGARMTMGAVMEITTMRKEGIYKDFRHPTEVSWTNKIEEDLARRDFTVNAMAMGISTQVGKHPRATVHLPGEVTDGPADSHLGDGPHTWGEVMEIVDPYNGQQDIQDGIIRSVGEPTKRFQEDALRLMRAVRIATELEFEIDQKTFVAIQQNAELIKEIAWERIRDELFKLLASANPYIGILELREAGILQIILPELERCFGIMQEGPKHDREYDIGEHSLLTLKSIPSTDPLVRFAALLHDIGKPDTVEISPDGNVTFYNHDIVGGRLVQTIAKRFNLSRKQADKLYRLVRWHLFTVDERLTDSAIRRFIKNVGLENIEDMMALRVGDRLGGGTENAVSWRMEKFQERIKQVLQKPFSISDLKINGNDVIKTLGIKPSPKVGEILQKLFEEVQEDSSKNNKEYLLEKVKQLG